MPRLEHNPRAAKTSTLASIDCKARSEFGITIRFGREALCNVCLRLLIDVRNIEEWISEIHSLFVRLNLFELAREELSYVKLDGHVWLVPWSKPTPLPSKCPTTTELLDMLRLYRDRICEQSTLCVQNHVQGRRNSVGRSLDAQTRSPLYYGRRSSHESISLILVMP